MGHVVLHCEDIEQMTAFYEGLLGFRLSDYFLRPYPARFFHCNPRHHSLALTATGKNAPHHLMMELFSLDDVGQGYDIAQGNEGQVAVTMSAPGAPSRSDTTISLSRAAYRPKSGCAGRSTSLIPQTTVTRSGPNSTASGIWSASSEVVSIT